MAKSKTDAIYRQLVEHMNEAVWLGDKHEKTIYANPKFCELMGYKLDEMLGRQSYDFWDEESIRRVRHVNAAHRRKNISSSYEGNLKTKDGKLIPVLLSGTALPDGGTIGIMTDLRSLKEKEEQGRILSAAVTQASDAIIVLDENGLIESWNKGAKILFGYKEEAVIGKPLQGVVADADSVTALKAAEAGLAVEMSGVHKTGSTLRMSARMTPVRGSTKKDMHWLFIARDITAQRKFEEELSSKYEKLKSAYNQFGIVRRQMDYIFDLVELSAKTDSLEELGDFIVNAVMMLTRVDACMLRVYNPTTEMLTLISSFGLSEDWQGKTSMPFKGSLSERAFKEKGPLRIIDVALEPAYQSAHLARSSGLSSLLMIPLIFHGQPVGTLSLYVKPEQKLELFENEFMDKYGQLIAITLHPLLKRAS